MTWQTIDKAPMSWGHMLLLYGEKYSYWRHQNGLSSFGGCQQYIGGYSHTHKRWVLSAYPPSINRPNEVMQWTEIKPMYFQELPEDPLTIEQAREQSGISGWFGRGLPK